MIYLKPLIPYVNRLKGLTTSRCQTLSNTTSATDDAIDATRRSNTGAWSPRAALSRPVATDPTKAVSVLGNQGKAPPAVRYFSMHIYVRRNRTVPINRSVLRPRVCPLAPRPTNIVPPRIVHADPLREHPFSIVIQTRF